jgi:hypothetical protein
MVDSCAIESVRLSPWSTPADGRRLGDCEWMNCENISSSPRALSADKFSREGDISGRHTRFRGMLFLTRLPCILLMLKRKGSIVDELLMNLGREVLQAIVVFWLKTKDG